MSSAIGVASPAMCVIAPAICVTVPATSAMAQTVQAAPAEQFVTVMVTTPVR